jgi:hypothetical protein
MTPESNPSPPPPPIEATAVRIAERLRGVRKAARSMLIAQRLGWIVAAVLLAIVVGGLADYFLRAPSLLRTMGLLLAAGTLIVCVVRFLIPALGFRPSLTEIALRVERSGAGEHAGVRGLLASALELGRHPERLSAPTLAAPVVAQAADKLATIRARQVFSPRPTIRAVGACAAMSLAFFAMTITWPTHTSIGLARMLLPWSNAQWPKRTRIADAMEVRVHPIGAALEFRAALVKSDRELDRTNVGVYYRLVADGSAGPVRKALLSVQQQDVDATLPDGSPTTGKLFERLIEPTGLGVVRTEISQARVELEYWFESDDDATPARRILLIDPPSVVRATAQITPPGYAASILGASPGAAGAGTQTIDLGSGSDDRSAPAPILAGSLVSVRIEFNKPLTVPALMDPSQSAEAARWLQSALGPEAPGLFKGSAGGPTSNATLTADGRSWTLSWRHWDSLRLIVKPTDEHRITSGEDAAFRFDALKDNPPTATVTTPAEDKSVLATAIVEIAGEARDDVALAWVSLERQASRRNASSEGGTPEPVAERVEVARTVAADLPVDPTAPTPPPQTPDASIAVKRLVSTHTLDLSAIDGLKPGDEVWITALAADAFNLEGQRHEPVRSTVRKLRILSREQLVEQVWSELSTVRRTAIKIDQDQKDIAEQKPSAGPAGEEASARAERAQAGLTERLSRQNQAMQRLGQRVKENGLTDQSVRDVLRNASESLDRAGQHSAESSKNLGEAERKQSREGASEKAGEAELDKAAEEQQRVRDELTTLIDMLDRGEDAFASKRAVERMLEQQKALRERTAETGRQTAGKPADQLSGQQQDDLGKIAQEQKALADQLRDQVRKMQDRQSKVREKDASAAEAMAQAAAQSTRDQTPERMDQASKQAESNQTSGAQQQQTRAIESLEQMLDTMAKAQSNKDETLKRALASLIDSLKSLIVVQKASIGALGEAFPKGATEIAKLERPMILHHQNTLGVLEQGASSGIREIAPISEKIAAAGEAMATTIPDLREARAEPAQANEGVALQRLEEALELAQKINENAEQQANDRKRAELRAKYEQAAKTQAELRDSAQGLVGAEENRRTRSQARLIADDQTALNATVDTIRTESRELANANVFVYAHGRLDTLMGAAAAALNAGAADAAAVRNQTSAARLLKSLADALDDRQKADDPFRKNEQGGGSGGGSGDNPVVPSAAEVVLLRLMQIEALDMARGAASAPQPDAALVGDAGRLQRDIAEQGRALIKKLEERGKSEGPTLKPAPKPGDKPEAHPDPKPDKPAGEGGPQE